MSGQLWEKGMTEAWKEWPGQVVNGEFPLRQYLGGSENSAVFLTEHGETEPRKAAIRLQLAAPEESELQLSQWELVTKLSHPHVVRLFQIGRCQLSDIWLLYVVMEYAEENLSQIVPRRLLTPAEARDMLEPVIDALAYVHGQGFVHGHIKPANIMGVDDQLKISSDGLYRMGKSRFGLGKSSVYDAPEMAGGWISAAADVWSLGMTLVESLTQYLPVWERSEQGDPVVPETLPAPFLELARHCLRRDFQHRWTVEDMAAHMRRTLPALQGGTASSPQPTFVKWRYIAPLVALGVVLAATLVVPRLFNCLREASQAPSTVIEQPSVQSEPARKAVTPEAGKSEAKPPTSAVGLVPGRVVHQVLPDVPRKARDTIRGKVRVGVRVRVDPSGNAVGAKLDSPGPSRYFAQLALKSARRWKFYPAKVDARNVPSEWILRFEFGKAGATVLSVREAP
jgi:TonB family protein